jgi:hypothetical protein
MIILIIWFINIIVHFVLSYIPCLPDLSGELVNYNLKILNVYINLYEFISLSALAIVLFWVFFLINLKLSNIILAMFIKLYNILTFLFLLILIVSFYLKVKINIFVFILINFILLSSFILILKEFKFQNKLIIFLINFNYMKWLQRFIFNKFLFIFLSLNFAFCETTSNKFIYDSIISTGNHFGYSSDETVSIVATVGFISIVGLVTVGGIHLYNNYNKSNLLPPRPPRPPRSPSPSSSTAEDNKLYMVGENLDEIRLVVHETKSTFSKVFDMVDSVRHRVNSCTANLIYLQKRDKTDLTNLISTSMNRNNRMFITDENKIQNFVDMLHGYKKIQIELGIYKKQSNMSFELFDKLLNKFFHGKVTIDVLLNIINSSLEGLISGSLSLFVFNNILKSIDLGIDQKYIKFEDLYTKLNRQLNSILVNLQLFISERLIDIDEVDDNEDSYFHDSDHNNKK